ncbi:MAG: hypothetical protein RLZZ584_2548 [Pseudomonadota bacterium]
MKSSNRLSAPWAPLASCTLALIPVLGFGATPNAAPNAGDLLRQTPQGSGLQAVPVTRAEVLPREQAAGKGQAAPADVKLTLRTLTLSGVVSLDATEVRAQVQDAVGRELDFSQLQGLADKISAYYRARGYVLARAFLPAQRIENGAVEIAVVEGQLGRVNIQAAAPLDPKKIEPYLAGIKAGEPLRSAPLEEGLLRLSDLPGVKVQSVLRPGQAVGTTDLDVQVQGGRSLGGSVSLDNYGNRYTGRTRLSGRLTLANALDLGDSLDANVATSGAGMSYGRLAWQHPVGSAGHQAGVAFSALNYKLGKDFTSLKSDGDATDLTLYGLASLQRSRLASAQAQLSLDIKRFDDRLDSKSSRKSAEVLALGLSGNRQEAEGSHLGALTLTVGRLHLKDVAPGGDVARTAGTYTKLAGSYEHQRVLADNLYAGLRVGGQWAFKNLDSSEKFSLGGVQGVRAYASGAAGTDDGVQATVELSRFFGPLRAKVFADIGAGRVAHKPQDSDVAKNKRQLSALGVGVDAALPAGLQLQAAAAAPLRSDENQTERGPRLWLLLSKVF